MNKLILTLAITIAFSTLSFGQIKVTSGGDFCIGQNYSTNLWFKSEINGERKVALGLSTRHEEGYSWASISKAINPTTKHWIVSQNGYTNHNFWVETWGAVNAHQYFTLSDASLKENLRPISDAEMIINSLNPYYYDFKQGFNGTDYYDSLRFMNRVGFVAQDIQAVAPNLVKQLDSSQLLSVDYQSFIPILTQYVKNQNQRINDLEDALLLCCASSESTSNSKSTINIEQDKTNLTVMPNAELLEEVHKVANQYSIHPNPNNGKFTIIASARGFDQILVTNLSGEMVENYNVTNSGQNAFEVDLKGNSSGVYYVHILINQNIVASKKIVVLN